MGISGAAARAACTYARHCCCLDPKSSNKTSVGIGGDALRGKIEVRYVRNVEIAGFFCVKKSTNPASIFRFAYQ